MKRKFTIFVAGLTLLNFLSTASTCYSSASYEGEGPSKRAISRSVAGALEDAPAVPKKASKPLARSASGPSFLKRLFIFGLLATSGLSSPEVYSADKSFRDIGGKSSLSYLLDCVDYVKISHYGNGSIDNPHPIFLDRTNEIRKYIDLIDPNTNCTDLIMRHGYNQFGDHRKHT